jgi:hypothetical protein
MVSRFAWMAVCFGAVVGCSGGTHCVDIRPEYAGAIQLPAPFAYYGTRTDGPGRFGGDSYLPSPPIVICTESEGKDESWTLIAWIFQAIGCPEQFSHCAPEPGDPQGGTDFIFKSNGTTVVHVTIVDPSP